MPCKDNIAQVGGTHYDHGGTLPQHWDLAIAYEWDVFQYQITKYVMRWKSKHDTPAGRLQDLLKARSFLDKYIANAAAFDPVPYRMEECQMELDLGPSCCSGDEDDGSAPGRGYVNQG